VGEAERYKIMVSSLNQKISDLQLENVRLHERCEQSETAQELKKVREALDFEREDMACGQTQHDDETYRGMSISFSPGDHHPSVRL
jgi:hypothetical protein